MDKQNVVCICKGILFCLTKEKILTHAATWMTLEDFMGSEINQSYFM
jgi:hypothetical protein